MFLKWCVGKKWIARNPLDGIEGVGRRRHGKEQIRIDEARTWLAKATERADAGEEGAVAAMLALLLGMRATENHQVGGDLDDEGRLLWIPETKTAAGRRTLQVPELVRGNLRASRRGRGLKTCCSGATGGTGRGNGCSESVAKQGFRRSPRTG